MNDCHNNEAASGDNESTQQTPASSSGDVVATLKRRPSSSNEQPDRQRPAPQTTAATLGSQQLSKRQHINGPRESEPSRGDRNEAEAEAAVTIQRAWRHRVLSRPVGMWQRANVTVERLKSLSFEEATQLMRGPTIVQGSEALMQALLKTSPALSSGEDSDSPYKLPGRTFVVGHLFTAHPQLLVTDNSHLDAMVESAAMVMTQTYAQFAAAFISHHASWYQKQQTSVASFKAFYSALDSWKRSDAQKLLLTMERHYLELDRLWQSVQRRTRGEGDETWRAGIRGQREDLLAKIRTLGGSDAVEALMQRQRELRLTYSDPQLSQTPSLAPPTEQLRADDKVPSPVVNGVRAMHVDSRHGGVSAESGDLSVQEACLLPDSATGDSTSEAAQVISKPFAVLAKAISDPVSQDVDRVLGNFDLTAATALQDAKLAHELVLDPDLCLKPAATNTLVGAVQQAVTKAFFDHIKQEIALGNSDHVVGILTQLRLDMRTIVPPSSQQRETLDRELDPEWMTAQLSNGALDVHAKFRLVLLTARSVCAPIRDDAIDSLLGRLATVDFGALADTHKAAVDDGTAVLSDAAKSSVGQLLEITQEIMQLIRNVRLDALNHQLDTTVRPWLRLHAVEYEQTKMAQMLETRHQGNTQLVIAETTAWMHSAAARESSGQCRLPAKHVFLEAVLDMCFAPTALSVEETPVTWALDQQRIQLLQNELQVLLSASALSALAKALTQKSGVRIDESRRNALELVGILRADDVTMDRIVDAVQRMAGREEVVASLVPKTLAKDDPVFHLMEQQLRRFMLTELDKDEEPGVLARRLEGNSQAVSAALSSFSMAVVHKEVVDLLLRVSRLCSFNWQVYSPWYTKIQLP
ncbi:hypothetical protein GGH94_004940 [Coemansia aciculifera]|uniref:Tcp11-domain-containing protein n=1 Tax=Coemansia aciculifera TaxID=417176 RepID=A0A9W8IH41_9FUNG|nr:hypothetical protein GGH94_004940 [Coemansia aciculifera]